MADTLDLMPEMAEIERLNIWYDELCTQAALDAAVTADMKLCPNEAVANVISYGKISSGKITCTISIDPQNIEVVLSDPGIPFDPTEAPVATAMDGLETAQIGGFGIKLIRETAREINYRREDGRNILTLVCA